MTNVNCLEGIACPQCGNDSMFYLDVRTLAVVTDDGAETFGNIDWDADSYTQCPECQFNGSLAEFRTDEPNDESNNSQEIHP